MKARLKKKAFVLLKKIVEDTSISEWMEVHPKWMPSNKNAENTFNRIMRREGPRVEGKLFNRDNYLRLGARPSPRFRRYLKEYLKRKIILKNNIKVAMQTDRRFDSVGPDEFLDSARKLRASGIKWI